jgi:hypothetical protein
MDLKSRQGFIQGGAEVPKRAIVARVLPVLAVAAVLALSFLGVGKVAINGTLVACAGYGYGYGYITGPPQVTGVNPSVGPLNGGTSVAISGLGFCNPAPSVSFGGTAASFVVNSDTLITATSPAHAAGVVDVRVTTTLGTSMITPADQFTYSSTANNDYWFQWYDKASTGMIQDNVHLLNTSASTANITVSVPGATAITKAVAAGAATYVNFPQGTIGGPVKISSDQPILSSQRVQFYSTFNEVWAASTSAAATTSYFNWFDNASAGMIQDNIHVINPGSASAVVTVSLSGVTSQVVTVAPGAGTYVTFPAGTIGGPVKVSSTAPVLSSQRVQFNSSFNEAWAGTAAQAAITSYVNWFDSASTGMNNDNIHLLNPGTASASVTVALPGSTSLTATVAGGAEAYVKFPAGTIGGPVKVTSSQPILASQRVVFFATFNEVWAKDGTTAVITGVFTWYDKASTGMAQDNIHVVNPSATSATVTVTVPGSGATPLTLTVAAGAEMYASFPQGTIGGPVVVSSTQPVLASQRVQYFQSFNEVWAG